MFDRGIFTFEVFIPYVKNEELFFILRRRRQVSLPWVLECKRDTSLVSPHPKLPPRVSEGHEMGYSAIVSHDGETLIQCQTYLYSFSP